MNSWRLDSFGGYGLRMGTKRSPRRHDGNGQEGAQVDMDVDPGNPGEIEARAAELFVQATAAAEKEIERYRIATVGACERQLGEADGRPQDKELGRCADCGKRVFSEKVVEISTEKYGKVVCFPCQKIRQNAG